MTKEESEQFEQMKSALRVISIWAKCDKDSPETREKAMKDIYEKAMRGLGASDLWFQVEENGTKLLGTDWND